MIRHRDIPTQIKLREDGGRVNKAIVRAQASGEKTDRQAYMREYMRGYRAKDRDAKP